MGVHGIQSFCLLVLTCCPLSILLTTALTISSLRTDTLLCYFCPLLEKDKACTDLITTTQCQPDEVCASSRGYEGTEHVLSAQGCVQRDLCGSHEVKSRFGRRYKVSHTCCCLDKCNKHPNTGGGLKILLGMIKGTKNNVHTVQHIDSCANYTSPLAAKSVKE